jgi:rare lipoprotein A
MTLRLPRFTTLVVLAALFGPAAVARADAAPETGGAQPTAAPSAPLTPGGLRGGSVRWQGSLPGTHAVRVERLDPASGTWSALAHTEAADDGTFVATWLGDALGSYTVRAVPDDGSQPQASTADAPLIARVTVYRSAKATWYGPGFFGRKTACGTRMSRGLVGVAHKRLPCGTPVEVFYKGRSLVVPVVDRGPFANGAAYDLTQAAAQALGMTATDRIGVAPRVAGVIAKTSR